MKFKPYPMYKKSGVEWLGEVPEGWKNLALKHAAYVVPGFAFPSEEFCDIGVPVLRIGDINIDGTVSMASCKFVPKIYHNTHHRYYVKTGEMVMAMTGATVGKIGLYVDQNDSLVNQRVCVFKSTNQLLYKFLWYVLNSQAYVEHIKLTAYGGAQPNISDVGLLSFRFALPDVIEQVSIAAFLDRETAKIDSLIAKQEKLIDLLKEKRQAVISHAVTKGLDPTIPMKPSGVEWLGDIPINWIVSKLGFEAWVRARLGWKGLKAEEYVEDGFAFLATPNIKGNDIDFENVNYINQNRYDESPEIKLSPGDVVLTKDGSTLGTVNVVRHLPRPATVNSSIAVITPGKALDGIFLYSLFQSSFMQNTIQRTKGGMGVPHLFQEDLNKFHIPLPPLQEQEAIVYFLTEALPKIDTLIAKAQQAIALQKEHRTALISAAVTGKIDVRGESQDRKAA